jgi:hypothetical protein
MACFNSNANRFRISLTTELIMKGLYPVEFKIKHSESQIPLWFVWLIRVFSFVNFASGNSK